MAARRLRHQSLQLAAGGKNPRSQYPRGLKARFASARPPRLASYSQRAAAARGRGLHLWHHTQSRLRPYLPAAATRRRGRDGHCRQPEFEAAYALRERQRKDSDEVFPACNMNILTATLPQKVSLKTAQRHPRAAQIAIARAVDCECAQHLSKRNR